jgi:general secretion pathway protein H
MPISATGMSRRNNSARACRAGFTLVEMLVVVVIIAIIATGALLSIGAVGRDTELETESERMLALLKYAREQAELRTRELGLLCEENRYRFVVYEPFKNEWVEVETDEALRARELPEGLSLSLVVEARPVVLRRPPDSKDLTPQIMIYSNGDLTPFELTVRREDQDRSVTLASNDEGVIEASSLKERAT